MEENLGERSGRGILLEDLNECLFETTANERWSKAGGSEGVSKDV